MSIQSSKESVRDQLIKNLGQFVREIDLHLSARSNDETRNPVTASVNMPAMIVFPPYGTAMAQLTTAMLDVLPLIEGLADHLDDIILACYRAQMAKAFVTSSTITDDRLNEVTRAFVEASEEKLRDAGAKLDDVLSSMEWIEDSFAVLDENQRRCIGEMFASAYERLNSSLDQSGND